MRKKVRDHTNRNFRHTQSGQALVEYVILLVIMAGLSLMLFRGFKTIFYTGFLSLNAEIEKSLITGSFTTKSGKSAHEDLWIK